METSASFTQSTTVERCLCTAWRSTATTFARMLSATYRMLLSLLDRNLHRHRMLTLALSVPLFMDTLACANMWVWGGEYLESQQQASP